MDVTAVDHDTKQYDVKTQCASFGLKPKRARYNNSIMDTNVIILLGLSSNGDFYESDLEQALITHLQKFLLESGRGFPCVASQKQMTFDGRHFRDALVFCNYICQARRNY